MLNSRTFFNSRPDGVSILEVVPDQPNGPRQFVPLKRTDLAGLVTGPLANLTLTQTFALSDPSNAVIEALYRFPLPGDAAVTGVRVHFGDVEIHTTLKERESAEEEYREAKQTGRQAALVTRESPDVFTLAVAGIRAGQDIVLCTEYVQLAKPEGTGWSLRVPLTTSPRFVREDESNSRHASGQPLAILRDPGHRFSLDLTFSNAEQVASKTHSLAIEGGHVRLRDREVLPDQDCVITWQPNVGNQTALQLWTHSDSGGGKTYFLALCAPPKQANSKKVPREVILLVDHSGSMEGAKWEAANWAVERFLAGLSEQDSFALGLFHDTTKWFAERPRKATPETISEAVTFLRNSHDSGGTQLGVALEQALDQPRAADSPSRHVLILTDAEVSDAGRILQLADSESAKSDRRRRVSVLCIDSAPNEALASQLAERGGGVSRFLTSNPDEDDVTTALDEVLADWSAPVLTGLTLEVNRAGAEAIGRMVSLVTPGPMSGIDIGDLPAGRPVWVVGRVAMSTEPLSFRLCTGTEVIAEQRVELKTAVPGLKALFGADRVRRLEYVMNANYSSDDLRTELSRLGYEVPLMSEAKVYAENTREAAAKVVRELLVRESIASGIPCSETAFVAVRNEVGQPVTETRIVANALPHGWSDGFAGVGTAVARALFASPFSIDSVDSMLCEFTDAEEFDDEDSDEGDTDNTPALRSPIVSQRLYGSRRSGALLPTSSLGAPAHEVRITIASGQHKPADGAVLFETTTEYPLPETGHFTFLSLTFIDKAITTGSLNPELTLLLYLGDLTAPRARVKLADVLRQGGRRPLNLSFDADQVLRLTLADPSAAWKDGVPAMEIVLG
jgi:Ca-activated chloride channel family protein